MSLGILKKTGALVFSCLLFLVAYCYGILTPSHTLMMGNDFYTGVVVSALVGFATLLGLLATKSTRLGFSTLTWVSLAALILIQPLFNRITYPDMLVFPVGVLSLSVLLSIFVVNIPRNRRDIILHIAAWLFLGVAVLSSITQLIQYFYSGRLAFIAPAMASSRIAGNISQPNMASFVNVLAIIASLYLFYLHHQYKRVLILLALTTCILALGIGLSISRAGVVMLFVGIALSIFYPWASSKLRFFSLVFIIVPSVIGYQIGTYLTHLQETYEATSGVERLLSGGLGLRSILLQRAWWAFSEHPLLGVGYNNYLSFGLDNIERMSWFEPADHAHNVLAQIAAELGLVGLTTLLGVFIVLFKQIISFVKRSFEAQHVFIWSVLVVFILYSFSDFPLWYPEFLFTFVFFLGLVDVGFELKNPLPKQGLVAATLVLSILSATYAGLYAKYLYNYEIVIFAHVGNQQKIDAYQSFPNIFGFTRAKEEMLHTVVDEEKSQVAPLIQVGERLMRNNVTTMTIARIQVRLLIRMGKQAEADKLNRRLCIWEYQQTKNCKIAKAQLLEIDPNDELGYVKRLEEWYEKRYGNQ